MRTLKFLAVILLLAMPAFVHADASDVPGSAAWYFHVDLGAMRSEGAGQGLYAWLGDEVFDDIREDVGIDLDSEVDRLTAYSLADQGPVIVIEGNISQETKDKVLAYVAVSGDLQPLTSSGKSYYHLQDSDDNHGGMSYESGDISIDIDSLEDEAWVSMAIANKLVVTSNEAQMQQLLASNGKIAGAGSHNGALIVLTAEKTLLQAGMNSELMNEDGDSDWDSNILRNAKQIAVLVAAAENKLAIEAKLMTTESDMAQSMASVVRGLIGLASFSDELDAEALAVLRGTRVEVDGNELSISLAIDPALLVATISD